VALAFSDRKRIRYVGEEEEEEEENVLHHRESLCGEVRCRQVVVIGRVGTSSIVKVKKGNEERKAQEDEPTKGTRETHSSLPFLER
jgi:hypothetical protein